MPSSHEIINQMHQGTLAETLGIIVTRAEEGYLEASMPVDHRTIQPMKLLHGGASAALAETLGSVGSFMMIDQNKQGIVGLELNINHLRSVSSGKVHAKAKAIHRGRRTHVWQIELFSDEDKLASTSRLTVMIVDRTDNKAQ